MASTQESVALPSVDQRQDDKAVESVRARQMRRRLQHKGGQRANPWAQHRNVTSCAIY